MVIGVVSDRGSSKEEKMISKEIGVTWCAGVVEVVGRQ